MNYTDSLRKYKDFRHVYNNGISKADKFLVMYVMPNGTDRNRLGISVSKKVGNSVVRHRIKRLIKESYRLSESHFYRGRDIVVIARSSACGRSFLEIERSLIHLGMNHAAYKKKESGSENEENTYHDD